MGMEIEEVTVQYPQAVLTDMKEVMDPEMVAQWAMVFGAGSGTGGYGIGGGYGSEGLKSKLGDSFRKCDPNNPRCPSDEVCGCRNPMRMMEWMCCKPNNPAGRH